MTHLSSPAIVLRAIEHGDHDKIVTFFTLKQGKISLIAKGAKKSIRRFAGILELFSVLNLVWTHSRGRGLPLLQEASVAHPFERIRTDIARTAYASYWCELVYHWMEPGQKQVSVYELLEYALDKLNAGDLSEGTLHLTFQLRFMVINGFRPGLEHCSTCRLPLKECGSPAVAFDARRGGVLCQRCGAQKPSLLYLSRGTIKLLQWVLKAPLEKLHRLRFSEQAMQESLDLLEAFVPYHLGKETKSLKFLKALKISAATSRDVLPCGSASRRP
jgi:DNA repair protein RecO (recombination protein O)